MASAAAKTERALDSSETLVAANARVPILSYELVGEDPTYKSLKDALAAAIERKYVPHDVVFLNLHHGPERGPEPRAGVLLSDPRYAYDGNVVRSGLVVAKDYDHQAGRFFRTFHLGRNFRSDPISPLEVVSENCRCLVKEIHLGRSESSYDSLSEALAAAERQELFPYDPAFLNVSHGSILSNEPLPALLLVKAGEIPPSFWMGKGFIARKGNQHNLYLWQSSTNPYGPSIIL